MKRVLMVILVVVLTGAGAAAWLITTQSGLKTILLCSRMLLNDRLSVASVRGSLHGESHISGVSFKSEEMIVSLDEIHLNWSSGSLLRGRIHIVSLIIQGAEIKKINTRKEQKREQEFLQLPKISFPLPLVIEQFRLTDFTLDDGSRKKTVINHCLFNATFFKERLVLEKFTADFPEGTIQLTGELETQKNWPVELTGGWQYQYQQEQWQGTLELEANADSGDIDVEITKPFSGSITSSYSLEKDLMVNTELKASGVNPALVKSTMTGTLDLDIHMTTSVGSAGPDVDIIIDNIQGDILGYPISLHGQVGYVNRKIRVERLEASSGKTVFNLSGEAGEELALDFSLRSPDISEILPGASGNIELTGKIDGRKSNPSVDFQAAGGRFEKDGMVVEALTASGNARFKDELVVELAAEFTGISKGEYTLDDARLNIAGQVKDHRIEVQLRNDSMDVGGEAQGGLTGELWRGNITRLQVQQRFMQDLELTSQAPLKIDNKSATLDNVCLSGDDGSICLEGSYQEGIWQSEIALTDFDTAIFHDDVPGRIDARMKGSGRTRGKGAGQFSVELVSLQGELRDHEITGAGKVEVENGKILVRDLQLMAGDAFALINGNLEENLNFSASVEVPDIGRFLPEARGFLKLEASLSGPQNSPLADLDLTINDLEFDQYSIQMITAEADIDVRSQGVMHIDILGEKLAVPGAAIDQLLVQSAGTVQDHRLHFSALSGDDRLSLDGHGSYLDQWKLTITEGILGSKKIGDWSLEEQARLFVDSKSIESSNICVEGQKGDFCMKGNVNEEGMWEFVGRIDFLDLSLFSDLQLLDQQLSGTLTGDLSATGKGNELSSFTSRISIPQTVIARDSELVLDAYVFNDSEVQAMLEGKDMHISLQSGLDESGSVEGRVVLERAAEYVSDIGKLPVTGEIKLTADDLSLVSIITNASLEAKGLLDASIDIEGTLGNPMLKGDLALHDGDLAITGLGIIVSELAASMSGVDQRMDFDVSGKSGPGWIKGDGTLSYDEESGIEVSAKLTGKDVDIVNLEEYTIRANPDVGILWGESSKAINGVLEIPFARITKVQGKGRITPSDDVIIVDEQEADRGPKKLPLSTNVSVILGDDVQLDRYGIKSYLRGNLKLMNSAGKTLTAFGELVVKDGVFSLYSTELEILRGRLMFSGGLIDNPGVDFRAQRKVDKKVVGVDVSGVLSDLNFELFSDPAMEDSDILAYILVGRSMYSSSDDEQSLIGAAANALGLSGANKIMTAIGGYLPIDEIYLEGSTSSEDMSLVLGKNLTEDIFIGYDHNFFDSKGEFKIRYTIGKGFSFETKSSIDSTSGDLLYTIEK